VVKVPDPTKMSGSDRILLPNSEVTVTMIIQIPTGVCYLNIIKLYNQVSVQALVLNHLIQQAIPPPPHLENEVNLFFFQGKAFVNIPLNVAK
jgi:hypothetical protein